MNTSKRSVLVKCLGFMQKTLAAACLIAMAFVSSGCATPLQLRPSADPVQTWFDTLTPGTTSKEDVLLKLGLPSAQFEGERILTFRLAFEPSQGLKPVSREVDLEDPRFLRWFTAEYNLVLVFDTTHRLTKKGLVCIK